MEKYQKQISVSGRAWNIVEAGSGAPILFLHNGGGTLWNWAHQLEYFSTRYHIIAPDLPGFGRSHRPGEPLTLNHYVQGLRELLDVLDCLNPILVGNCIGSSIALEFAICHPEKVSALAVFNVCGGIPMLTPPLQFWAGLRPATKIGRRLHQFALDSAAHPRLRRWNRSLIYANSEPELHPMLEQVSHQQGRDPTLRASLYWLAMGLDSFNVFSQHRQRPERFPPVLLGWGKQNRTLSVQWADFIAEWLDPQRFCLVEGAGHMPMYEQPRQVNAVLESFFSGIIDSKQIFGDF